MTLLFTCLVECYYETFCQPLYCFVHSTFCPSVLHTNRKDFFFFKSQILFKHCLIMQNRPTSKLVGLPELVMCISSSCTLWTKSKLRVKLKVWLPGLYVQCMKHLLIRGFSLKHERVLSASPLLTFSLPTLTLPIDSI